MMMMFVMKVIMMMIFIMMFTRIRFRDHVSALTRVDVQMKAVMGVCCTTDIPKCKHASIQHKARPLMRVTLLHPRVSQPPGHPHR